MTENAMTVGQARLRQVIDAVASLRWAAEQIERVGMDLDPSPAKVERLFAVTCTRSDIGSTWRWPSGSLRDAREMAADLNRRQRSPDRAEVVSRWRWTLPDGTTITTAWQTHDTNEEQR